MKGLLLLLPLLFCSPSWASSNPAEIKPEPFSEVFGAQKLGKLDGFFCGHSLKRNELVTNRIKGSRCTIQFVEDEIYIDGEPHINREKIVRYWRSKISNPPLSDRNYFVVTYREGQKVKASVFLVIHETWQATFWNQLNFWITEGKILQSKGD